MKKLYKCTFHGHDEYIIREYLDESNILYVCHHFGEDESGLPINSHFHVLTDRFIFGYDGVFTYISEISSSCELSNYLSYCEDRHCEFNRLKLCASIAEQLLHKSKGLDINDLIDEIVYFLRIRFR